ncbi:MAG: J domain-containing protein [Verrucomicrobiota bacterium]|jgi:hypothetical protein
MANTPQNSVQPSTAHRIGEHLYRKWRKPSGDFWYEVYFIVRKTRAHVDVKGFMEEHLPAIRLDRGRLERSGSAASIRHQAVFYTEMPEEYRKQTLGYLAREEPRTVLALPEDFTGAQLKAAYRAAVKRTRPDLDGDYEEFLRIQAAYEALTQPLSVGAMLKAAHRGSTT